MKIQKADGTFSLVAQTLQGLESVLAEEIRTLGGSQIEPLKRAVRFSGDWQMLMKANMCLRTTMRISAEIAHFTINNADDLYEKMVRLSWARLISDRDTFVITPIVKSRFFSNTQYAAFKAKDAIVDNVRDAHGQRPNIDKDRPDFRIVVKIHEQECTLLIDSSGDLLFKRGYRQRSPLAPINECLAAGMILLSDWDQKSNLLDPMCGSGTIPIEAAMIAKNIAPNVRRKRFGFMDWPSFDMEAFRDVQNALIKEEREVDFKIFARDKDFNAIRMTKDHSHKARVNDVVVVEQHDFFDTSSNDDEIKSIIMNPPYDERIGLLDAEDYYKEIGDTFKKHFTDCSAWIISSNLEALKNVGLRASRKINLYNGPLESKFVNFQMYAGTKKVHKQLKSNTPPSE